jgi:hypothetical protein
VPHITDFADNVVGKKFVELRNNCKTQVNKLRFKKINYVQWGLPHSILHISYGTEKKTYRRSMSETK